MMNVVIVDDEIGARVSLRELVKKNDSLNLIGEANSVQEGMELVIKEKPELILLDIELNDGIGFDLIDKIKEKGISCHIIFCTSHDSYAIRAIKYAALDYLLKPILETEFNQAIKVASERGIKVSTELLSNLYSNISSKKKHKIALLAQGKYVFVELSEVKYIKSDNHYCTVHLSNGSQYFVSKSMKDFDNLLGGPQFIRVHRECMINIDYVHSYSRDEGGLVTMVDGECIPVSRRRKQIVEQYLLSS